MVHLIRHGESEYNAATNLSKSFADPQIFDPGLTERGRKQVGFACCMHALQCTACGLSVVTRRSTTNHHLYIFFLLGRGTFQCFLKRVEEKCPIMWDTVCNNA